MLRAGVLPVATVLVALIAADGCTPAEPEPLGGTAPDEAFEREGVCPPGAPFGTTPGDVIPDIELPDCDGNLHRVHDLCDREAAWIFSFAPW